MSSTLGQLSKWKQTNQNRHSALAAFTGVKVLWVEFAASVEVFIYYSYKWAQKHIFPSIIKTGTPPPLDECGVCNKKGQTEEQKKV